MDADPRRGRQRSWAMSTICANIASSCRIALTSVRSSAKSTAGLLALLLFGGFIWYLGRGMAARQRDAATIRDQREWFRTTLASIGDGVIATDTAGNVTFLNGVAQTLTGWSEQEAQGQPLDTMFKIVNERTRQPAENPVDSVLRDGVIAGLANHTVLISKIGSEMPDRRQRRSDPRREWQHHRRRAGVP